MRLLLSLGLLAAALAPGFAAKPEPAKAPDPLLVRYYGQGFVYLVTTTGVRIAIDPYNQGLGTYKFPAQLAADVVLVSNEGDDSSGDDQLFGAPQIFRSVTAIGKNNARGLFFEATGTYRDRERGARKGVNAAFSFQVDGIRFGHLGAIGHVPDSTQRAQMGPIDVLFLPVGNPDLTMAELDKIAAGSNARIIIPIRYKTQFSPPDTDLRSLDEYLAGRKNVKRVKDNDLTLTIADLPATPTIYVLNVSQ